jgi:hypothetical protein
MRKPINLAVGTLGVDLLKVPTWKTEIRPKEAAAMIGCSVGYVYTLMKDGQISSRALVRRGYERGIRLIAVDSIRKFLSQAAQAGKSTGCGNPGL